jgi:uncharacterized membrane protein
MLVSRALEIADHPFAGLGYFVIGGLAASLSVVVTVDELDTGSRIKDGLAGLSDAAIMSTSFFAPLVL